MYKDDYIIYWTDGLNPPRRLSAHGILEPSGYPFEEKRQEILDQDPDFDIKTSDIWLVRGRSSYGTGGNVTIFSTHTGGTPGAAFGGLPEGTRCAVLAANAEFVRQGLRVNVTGYGLEVGIVNHKTAQGAMNYSFADCNWPGPGHFIKVPLGISETIVIPSLEANEQIVFTARRTSGGFLFYSPCNWHNLSHPRIKYRTYSVYVALPKGVSGGNFSHAGRYLVLEGDE